jgi:hypothetical protein
MPMKPPAPAATGQSDDLWERICARPRPHKVVDYPVKGDDGQPLGKLVIQVLQQHEIETAAGQAGQRARRALATIIADKRSQEVSGTPLGTAIDAKAFDELYDNIRATEILAVACRKTSDPKLPAFPSADEIRKRLTADEVGVLFAYYATVQSELGPIAAFMAEGDREAWIERLTVSGERYPLGGLTPEAHQLLTLGLAQEVKALRAQISRMATSSRGALPGDGSSTPSSEPASESDDIEESRGTPEE